MPGSQRIFRITRRESAVVPYTGAVPKERKLRHAEATVLTMTNMKYACETETVTGLAYEALDTDTCTVTGFSNAVAIPVCLTIPDCGPDGRRVVAIAADAFAGCDSLRVVSIPDSVESVGRRAFSSCSSLVEIRLGTASRLAVIGDRAFMGCDRLSFLRFGQLSRLCTVGKRAFASCTHLRSAVLPDCLSALPDGLFEGCRRLVQVRLPGHLARIGGSAFAACVSLETICLPDSLNLIEDTAFAWCGSLNRVRLPASTCLISVSAFRECPALPSLPELLGVG